MNWSIFNLDGSIYQNTLCLGEVCLANRHKRTAFMATNYFLSKSFVVTFCLSVIVALAQPSIGNALTFKKGEKKSFNDPSENSQVTQSMTKAEKKEYKKDQSRAKQKNIFQHDWRKVAKDDSYGSFKSPFFHSELVSGQNFPPYRRGSKRIRWGL